MPTTQNYYKIKHGLEAPSQDAIQVTDSTFPKVRPTLSLDFANSESVDERITFTRSTNATYYDGNGTLRMAYADQPRIDFNPATGECKGLLIEEQRTNLETRGNLAQNGYFLIGIPNVAIAPDGTLTASAATPRTETAGHWHELIHTVTANTTYTHSIYAKANGYSALGFFTFPDSSGYASTNQSCTFDLSNGTVASADSAVTARITNVGNGWYRCSATVTSLNATSGAYIAWTVKPNAGSGASYSGNGVSGLFLWQYQREVGAFPTSNIMPTTTFISRASSATYYDSTGVLRIAGTNQPRYGFEYDTASGKWVSEGLVLEAAATNLLSISVPNTIAATGQNIWRTSAGGTGSASGLAYTTETTAPDGSNTAAKAILSSGSGTTVSDQGGVSFYGAAGTVQSNNTLYTASIWLKAAAGQAGRQIQIRHVRASSYTKVTLTDSWQRISVTEASIINDVNFEMIIRQGSVNVDGTTSINNSATFYFWGAQLELGSVATSYIPTFGSAVTRAADVSTSVATTRTVDEAFINNLTPWYNAIESTLYGEGYSFTGNSTTGNNPALVSIDDGTNTNRYIIRRFSNEPNSDGIYSGLTFRLALTTNGVSSSLDAFPLTSVLPVEWDNANKHKAAFAIRANTQAAYADGLNAQLTSVAALPYSMPTRMTIGHGGSSAYWNGHVSKVAYYSKFLTNAEMQGLTK